MGKETMRVQVFLAKCGVCSRRAAKNLIEQERVKTNGRVVREPAFRINPAEDAVTVDNKKISLPDKVYLLLNKPRGVTTTRKDRFARRTVLDLVPPKYRHLHPVGRLDKDTEGLLLLTNDGKLTYRLTHPGFGVEKTYRVVIDKPIKPQDLKRLKKGIMLADGPASPAEVRVIAPKKLEITIHEGRKRQVRRMLAVVGCEVTNLTRTKECFLELGDLAEGRWRLLSRAEVERFREKLGLKKER